MIQLEDKTKDMLTPEERELLRIRKAKQIEEIYNFCQHYFKFTEERFKKECWAIVNNKHFRAIFLNSLTETRNYLKKLGKNNEIEKEDKIKKGTKKIQNLLIVMRSLQKINEVTKLKDNTEKEILKK